MYELMDVRFDDYREQIRKFRDHGKDWDSIKYACKKNEEQLKQYLNNKVEDDFFPEISVEQWYAIVKAARQIDEAAVIFKDSRGAGIIHDERQDNDVYLSEDRNTMWNQYKKKLKSKGFSDETIAGIHSSAFRTLKRISKDTSRTGPIKGMVVGNVQSGKTANMAALMAMACDNGWNYFVILSGTIENLRQQTEDRLYDDLKSNKTNLNWNIIHMPSKNSKNGERLSDLNFLKDSHDRYFSVVLKNSTRMRNLFEWLVEDSNKHPNMKVLIIDDEADQASINTKKMEGKDAEEIYKERTTINKLIVDIVDGKEYTNGKSFNPGAMNYVCYTATPYANFLNEASRESLYPRNFINFIDPAKEYFGPCEIFGVRGDSNFEQFDIIRRVDDFDIKNLENQDVPDSLYQSFYYFLCAAASMRYYQKNKKADGNTMVRRQPVSMLVHANIKQKIHDIVHEWIKSILENCRENLEYTLNMCKEIWERETKRVTRTYLSEIRCEYYPDEHMLNDYPSFTLIENYIIEILNTEYSNIMLNDDNDLVYHRGIHICVDNCDHNKRAGDEVHMRLAYPKKIKVGEEAPVFIIIGGSTLSRGLTIEGLVTTYFVRNTQQSDTLMQMGRWFGFRKGYELLPRIWSTDDIVDKFKFLSELDHELRMDLRQYREGGLSPSEYGPKILNSPKVSWLRVTARNRMQNWESAEMDFSGYTTQTTLFKNDDEVLRHNIAITEKFIMSIGSPKISFDNSSLVWRSVDFDMKIAPFLKEYKAVERHRAFNDMEAMISWLSDVSAESSVRKWNVVVAGTGNDVLREDEKTWKIGEYYVRSSNRSKMNREELENEGIIDVHALASPKHATSDVDVTGWDKEKFNDFTALRNSNKSKFELRQMADVGNIPLLVIYRLNKCYAPDKLSNNRLPMNAKEDLIGLYILLPGLKGNIVKKITVKIPKEEKECELDEN